MRPQPLGKGRRTGGPQEAALGSEPVAPGPPRASTEGSRGERMLRRGGAGGGGGPCPNSHSPSRSPPGPGSAARPAPVVPAARVSSRGSRTSQGAGRWGEVGREPRERGEQERGGGEGGTVAPAAGDTSDATAAAPLSHGSCGPSHHTGSRLRAPRRGATAVSTNQKPSTAGARPTQGAFAEGRAARKASTAARLPVNDSPAQPIARGEMTSSLREVWNWRSSGQEVGGGRG